MILKPTINYRISPFKPGNKLYYQSPRKKISMPLDNSEKISQEGASQTKVLQTHSPRTSTWWKVLFLLTSLTLVFQMYFWSLRALSINRELVSADDHYSWLLKAPQLEECPKGDCTFNNDVMKQVDTREYFGDELNHIRWREAHCLFDIYTPLYSALFLFVHKNFGNTWEYSYHLVSLFGEGVVSLGLILFSLAFFGWSSGAILLLFLNISPYALQGWFTASPSILTAGFFFLFMSIIVALRKNAAWLMPFFIFILLFMHPVGKIFSLAIFIYFLKIENLWLKFRKIPWPVYFSFLLFLFNIALVTLVKSPQFKLISWKFDGSAQYFNHVLQSVEDAVRFTSSLFNFPLSITFFGSTVTGIVLVGLAAFWGTRNLGRARSAFGLTLLFFLIVSVFHKMRGYPADLYSRVLRYYQVYAIGSFASAEKPFEFRQICCNKKINWSFLILFFIFVGAIQARIALPIPYPSIANQAVIAPDDSFYSKEQVQKIFDTNGKCDSIVYFSQMPMWFYILHGALNCQAIVTYVWPTPSSDLNLLIHEKHPKLIALQNPIYEKLGLPKLSATRPLFIRNDLLIPDETTKPTSHHPQKNITIKFRRPLVETKGQVWAIKKNGETVKIKEFSFMPREFSNDTQNKNFQVQITSNFEDDWVTEIKILSGALLLEGLSYGSRQDITDGSDVLWPWGQKIAIGFGEETLKNNKWSSFLKLPDISYYFPNGGVVIDDRGGTILIKTNPYGPNTP